MVWVFNAQGQKLYKLLINHRINKRRINSNVSLLILVDDSRVLLRCSEPDKDYINASLVDVSRKMFSNF